MDGRVLISRRISDAVLLIGRLLLAWIFLHEGVTLASNFSGAVEAAASFGVSAPLLIATIALQLAAGLSIATGLLARLGALSLGLFCIATAVLFHSDFGNQNEFLHFEKDLAIAGGMFVLAAAGPGTLSLGKWIWNRRN
jgi:putative oxidoreductase